jgi:monomeric sarcosine oxidase
MANYDVIVVGAGAIGLSTAYWCSKAGKKVLLLDQFDFTNDFFSSKGESRFFRILYSNPLYSLLAQSALPLWRQLESESGQKGLLTDTELLFFGSPAGLDTPEGNIPAAEQVMSELGIPYTSYTSTGQLTTKYPVFKDLAADTIGVSQAQGGVIASDLTLRALRQLCEKQGVTLLPNRTVRQIQDPGHDGPITVRTNQGDYTARKLVLVPSAWTNQVLSNFSLQLNLEIWTMTYAYYDVESGNDRFPLWFYFGDAKEDDGSTETYFGFPTLLTPGKIKVGADFTFHKSSAPPDAPPQPDQRILRRLDKFMLAHFNGLKSTSTEAVGCLYTMTPDVNFVIDLVPGHENIALFTGDTGQAFKFTPILGKILSELALSGTTQYNIQPFSIGRDGLIKKS